MGGDPFFELHEALEPNLRAGDLDSCLEKVTERLSASAQTPFHIVTELAITNEVGVVSSSVDEFISAQTFAIKALYTETNGFASNPDRWWFDLFAYDLFGGHDDYDWLADWESPDQPLDRLITLTGLEPLQEIYEIHQPDKMVGKSSTDPEFQASRALCDYAVVLKFQLFIREVASQLKLLEFPFLASAHGWTFVSEVGPNGRSGWTPSTG